MSRTALLALGLLGLTLAARPAGAQEWRPPSRQMPTMPEISELAGDWLTPRNAWFTGVPSISGVQPGELRAVGQARSGSPLAQVVHFYRGPLPVVVWQDRNGDGRSDIIEIYRRGALVVQIIDADYDGLANVMRIYSSGGSLSREDKL